MLLLCVSPQQEQPGSHCSLQSCCQLLQGSFLQGSSRPWQLVGRAAAWLSAGDTAAGSSAERTLRVP